MEATVGCGGERTVDAQLVRAGVEREFVRAERPSHGGVISNSLGEYRDGSAVLDPLLKRAREPEREAGRPNSHSSQLCCHEHMLERRCRRRRLVDRNLEVAFRRNAGCELADAHDRAAVLDGRTRDRLFIDLQWPSDELDPGCGVASEEIVSSCLQATPVGRLKLRSDAACGPLDDVVDHVVARVEGEHRESGGDGRLNVGSRFQVVGVRTEGPPPSRPANPGDRRRKNIRERTARTFELARRLLSQNRHDSRIGG